MEIVTVLKNASAMVAAKAKQVMEEMDNVMVSAMDNVEERDNQRIEISANDFGLLEDENSYHIPPFDTGCIEANVGSYLRNVFAGTNPSRVIRERVQLALDTLIRHRAIHNYNNLQVDGNVVSFNFQPAFPARYITLEVQI